MLKRLNGVTVTGIWYLHDSSLAEPEVQVPA